MIKFGPVCCDPFGVWAEVRKDYAEGVIRNVLYTPGLRVICNTYLHHDFSVAKSITAHITYIQLRCQHIIFFSMRIIRSRTICESYISTSTDCRAVTQSNNAKGVCTSWDIFSRCSIPAGIPYQLGINNNSPLCSKLVGIPQLVKQLNLFHIDSPTVNRVPLRYEPTREERLHF